MKKQTQKLLAMALTVVMLLAVIPLGTFTAKAATFEDINSSSVFVKQATNYTCTLASAVMLVRRAAMLNGNKNWNSITESAMRSTAWDEGSGLYWNFTYAGISVSHANFSGDKTSGIITFLAKHPEGIVVYNTNQPHAILITDYTDGVFYCSDPGINAAGRIPLNQSMISGSGQSGKINGLGAYWYVSSPSLQLEQTHTHSYTTYVDFSKTHPHYKRYKCSCGDIKENKNEPTFYDQCEECVEACKPKNVSVSTDKQVYAVGEAVTITPSADGAKHYTIRICYGEFGDDNIEYSDFAGFTGNKEFVPSKEGTYTVAISAVGERGYYNGARCTFLVEGEIDPTQFSSWSSVLPGNVTETDYDIETKTMYRYRDNTTTTQYGAWGANQTTNTKPTQSATLEIVSTTKYYNYYHYCCNYYSGSYNVDSIAYGTGSIYHTYQSTTELSATSVGDMGGKTLYGNHACAKNFLVWAKASPYETYTYTYHTRTANQVTVNGAWSSWQDTKPATASNRDIEEQTYYRYKLKHDHTESDWIIDSEAQVGVAGSKHKECTVCHTTLETAVIPPIAIPDENAPQIVIDSVKASAGKTVSVNISLKNNPGITSAKFKVYFPEDLTLTDVTFGDIGGQNMTSGLTSPVTLNWFNGLNDMNTENTVFATFTFEVEGNAAVGKKDITVEYDPDDVYNIDDSNVDFATVSGGVEVIAYIPGDINGDEKVNNKDLTRLFQYLSDWDVEVNEAALDINGDGKVNNRDLTRLFQYLSDWPVEIS